MVLGSRDPGRVGRRRISLHKHLFVETQDRPLLSPCSWVSRLRADPHNQNEEGPGGNPRAFPRFTPNHTHKTAGARQLRGTPMLAHWAMPLGRRKPVERHLILFGHPRACRRRRWSWLLQAVQLLPECSATFSNRIDSSGRCDLVPPSWHVLVPLRRRAARPHGISA